jgi:hypothetical protein
MRYLCRVACVSRRCNELACAPALYARLLFDRLTPMGNGRPRMLENAALATLCRRADASLRFIDVDAPSCRHITRVGLDVALQGVDRSVLALRVPLRLSSTPFKGVTLSRRPCAWR